MSAGLSAPMRQALRIVRANGIVWATGYFRRRAYVPLRAATLRALERRGLVVVGAVDGVVRAVPR